jgi:hypothetical protein
MWLCPVRRRLQGRRHVLLQELRGGDVRLCRGEVPLRHAVRGPALRRVQLPRMRPHVREWRQVPRRLVRVPEHLPRWASARTEHVRMPPLCQPRRPDSLRPEQRVPARPGLLRLQRRRTELALRRSYGV